MRSFFIHNKVILSLSGLLICLYSSFLFAHEGHHASVATQQEIIEKSKVIVQSAIKKSVLVSSWKQAKLIDAKLSNAQDEWIVQYLNTSVDKDSHLFIFFGLDGMFTAMNHSAK